MMNIKRFVAVITSMLLMTTGLTLNSYAADNDFENTAFSMESETTVTENELSASYQIGTDEYNERIKHIENLGFINYPELSSTDLFGKIDTGSFMILKSDKLWLKGTPNGKVDVIIEEIIKDSCTFFIPANESEKDSITNAINDFLVRNDIINADVITNYSSEIMIFDDTGKVIYENNEGVIKISIFFNEPNSNLESVVEYINENFKPDFQEISYNKACMSYGTTSLREFLFKADTEIDAEKFNSELKEMGFSTYMDEKNKSIIYAENENNIEVVSKICKYVTEKYNAYFYFNPKQYPAIQEKNSKGDANCDGECNIADAVAILQYLANSSKYPLSAQGLINADFDGDGITGADALTIQKMDAMK